jgi:hypothetical protein
MKTLWNLEDKRQKKNNKIWMEMYGTKKRKGRRKN